MLLEGPVGGDGFVGAVEREAHELTARVQRGGAGVAVGDVQVAQEVDGDVTLGLVREGRVRSIDPVRKSARQRRRGAMLSSR